ncbi:MAG: hypothetical protein HWQ38_33255 [Nostoc sp. NMS7]|uniref:hypothetical protein n=1 Tax=Nostoc sp. NMS7 TaxID=2815391 RepID=UPI0025FD6E5C|nr:hypothetical protein [Nostoc sp. NMS7]MBN3951082.1 hypothetical protein [Nostoc sp. NMS7]
MSDDKPYGFGRDARSPLASPLLYETLREGRRLANATLTQSTRTAFSTRGFANAQRLAEKTATPLRQSQKACTSSCLRDFQQINYPIL